MFRPRNTHISSKRSITFMGRVPALINKLSYNFCRSRLRRKEFESALDNERWQIKLQQLLTLALQGSRKLKVFCGTKGFPDMAVLADTSVAETYLDVVQQKISLFDPSPDISLTACSTILLLLTIKLLWTCAN